MATTDDGVRLYYEVTGSGAPIIFVHEFADDHRSWELQLQHFGRRYRAITCAARGYPPSGVPEDPASYSQNRAADDILAVLDHLGIQKAQSVASRWAVSLRCISAFRLPSRALSLCVVGGGYGAELNMREQFRAEADAVVASLRADGMVAFASRYAHGPTRVQFEAKDPRGFAVFKQALAGHSALGAANTQLGCQKERPSLYHLQNEMAGLTVPTLILTGDEDWPCLAPALLMKRTIPSAALSVMPNCGHTINLEAPDLFNGIVGDFVAHVDAGRWPTRDPRAMSGSITGIR